MADKGQYIDARDFNDLKHNLETLIEVSNHRITTISNDMCDMKGDVKTIREKFSDLEIKFSSLAGQFTVSNKVLWWVLGIISAIIVAGLIGSIWR